jgi:hypothetical protein
MQTQVFMHTMMPPCSTALFDLKLIREREQIFHGLAVPVQRSKSSSCLKMVSIHKPETYGSKSRFQTNKHDQRFVTLTSSSIMRKAVSDGRTRNERSEQNQQRPIERLARARVVEERVVGVCKGEVTVARACINEEQGERASMHASIGGGRTGTAQGENMEGAALHLT